VIQKAMEKILIKTYDTARTILSGKSDGPQKALFIGYAADPYDSRISRPVYLDQAQHFWVLGSTGMGKTKFLEILLENDIEHDRGFANIDFHGDATRDLIHHIATKRQQIRDDLTAGRFVLIQPADAEWSVGFNPLASTSQSSYGTALELAEIVRKLWGADALGPRSQEVIRNLFAALVEAGETIDMAEIFLSDASFRDRVLEKVQNLEVKQYWQYRFGKLSEKMQAMYREPTLNKFGVFLSDPNILAMVSQKKGTDFRQLMDDGAWIPIDLNKGQLKSNAYLLGAFFVAKLKEAAFSRVDVPESARRHVSLYLDEFQNIATDDFVEILTEARKQRFFCRLCHQNIDQIGRELKAAIAASATIVSFRISRHDANALAPELDAKEARRWEKKLTELKVAEAVVKRRGEKPMVVKIRSITAPSASHHDVEAVIELSRNSYARLKRDVLREVQERRQALRGLAATGVSKTESSDDDDGSEGQTGW